VQLAVLLARLDASELRVDELSRSLQVLVLAGDAKQMAAMGGAIGSVHSSVQADVAQQPSATATEVAQPVEAVVESVGSLLAEDSRMEADAVELEEALLVVRQDSVVAAEVEGGAPGQASVGAAEVEEAHQVLSGARLGPLAPLSVVTGGPTSFLGAAFAQLDAAQLVALAQLGGSATLVSSGIDAESDAAGGSTTVDCVCCAGTGRVPQLSGLPVDPVCHVCWGYGRVSHGDHVVSHMVAEYGMRTAPGGST